jgi:hypothetical protein
MYGFFSDHENVYLVLEDALGGNLFASCANRSDLMRESVLFICDKSARLYLTCTDMVSFIEI